MGQLTGLELSEAMQSNVSIVITSPSSSPVLSCVTNTTQFDADGGGTVIPVNVTAYPQIVQDARQVAMNDLVVSNLKTNTFIPTPVPIGCPRAEFMSKNPASSGGELWHDMIYGGFDIRLKHDIGTDFVTINVFEVEDGIQGGTLRYQS